VPSGRLRLPEANSANMSEDALQAARNALARLLPEADISRLDDDVDLRDALYFDSIDAIELIVALEDELGVVLTIPPIDEGFTLRTLAASLTSARPAGPAESGAADVPEILP
jgi:acyl carrier protein